MASSPELRTFGQFDRNMYFIEIKAGNPLWWFHLLQFSVTANHSPKWPSSGVAHPLRRLHDGVAPTPFRRRYQRETTQWGISNLMLGDLTVSMLSARHLCDAQLIRYHCLCY